MLTSSHTSASFFYVLQVLLNVKGCGATTSAHYCAFGLGAGCKPVSRGAGLPLFRDNSSAETTVTGIPMLPLHLTLAISEL